MMSLFAVFLTFYYSVISFLERKVFIKNIKKDDLVLDAGSGDKPLWRADVIVDKYLDDDQQRFGGSVLLDRRKLFFKADIECLPFRDKIFDFVFCAHVLEHTKHPDKAILELQRVGKSGYIEVPRASFDFLQTFPSHLWYCEQEGKTLVFKKRIRDHNFYLNSIRRFGEKFFDNALLQMLLAKNFNFIFIRIFWKDKIDSRIETKDGSPYIYDDNSKTKEKKFSEFISFVCYKVFYLFATFLFYKKKSISRNELLK